MQRAQLPTTQPITTSHGPSSRSPRAKNLMVLKKSKKFSPRARTSGDTSASAPATKHARPVPRTEGRAASHGGPSSDTNRPPRGSPSHRPSNGPQHLEIADLLTIVAGDEPLHDGGGRVLGHRAGVAVQKHGQHDV